MKLNIFLRQCVLACALGGASLGALGAPINFHVTLNTAGVANARFIDFVFTKVGGAAPAAVTVSNFTGAFGAVDSYEGAVTFNGPNVTIGNGPNFLNLVDYTAIFGGMFGFDVAFDNAFLGAASTDGSTFAVSVLDAALAPLGSIVQFDLSSADGIVANDPGAMASISAVPEPSAPLMWLTGLGLAGWMAGRRKGLPAR